MRSDRAIAGLMASDEGRWPSAGSGARCGGQPGRSFERLGPCLIEPGPIESGGVEPSHVEPSHVELSRVEPSHLELSRGEPGLGSLAVFARFVVVELLAAVCVLMAAAIWVEWFGRPAPVPVLVSIFSLAAVVLSQRLAMPPWWWSIAALFGPAGVLALGLAVPAGLWLSGLLLMLVAFGAPFVSRVPLYLSGRAVATGLEALLPSRPGARIVDLGAGVGSLLAMAARLRPELRCVGVEWAPLPWLLGRLRWIATGRPIDWRYGDLWRQPLTDCDLVYAYLSPAAMPRLAVKAAREMPAGSRLVSYRFAIPGVPADQVLRLGPGRTECLHVWQIAPESALVQAVRGRVSGG